MAPNNKYTGESKMVFVFTQVVVFTLVEKLDIHEIWILS